MINKQQIFSEIDKVKPSDYSKVLFYLKSLQKKKPSKRKAEQALQNLLALEGCLSGIKTSSSGLQKQVADILRQKYETN